jgi:hypothetical protein
MPVASCASFRLRFAWRRATGWLVAGGCALAIAWNLPYEGLDFLYLKRIKFVLAVVTALLLLSRHLQIPKASMQVSTYRGALCALAALSVATYLNFFAYHGGGLYVHLHDVAHYYLGAKYYGPLGHADLYTAMLRAESESYDDHFKTLEARDLASYEPVHVRALLERSDSVKAAFSPERWSEFKRDVAYFRDALGPHYAGVLLDHGFNATPVWNLFGGVLARWVPGFGWTGGGFLRTPWLVALVGAVCCTRRERYTVAGALFAGACLLRIFPVLLALPLLFRGVALSRRERRIPREYRALLAGFAITAGALLAATVLLPRGLDHWLDFQSGMSRYVQVVSPNLIGLTPILAHQSGPSEVDLEGFREIAKRRAAIHRVQLWLVALPLLAFVAWAAPRVREVSACALGIPLIFAGLNVAAYYYVFLSLLLLVNSQRPARLALIFAAEAASYLPMLFEDREALLHAYRSAFVGLLLLTLYAKPLREWLTRPVGASSIRESS